MPLVLIPKKQIIKAKKVGDIWPGILAPEQYRYWNQGFDWDPEEFRDYDMTMDKMEVRGSKSTSTGERINYTKKVPYVFTDGEECTDGYHSTGGLTDRFRFYLTGSIHENNKKLTDISERTEINCWLVTRLNLRRRSNGERSLWGYFNPSGSQGGEVLAFGYGWIDDKPVPYYNMNPSTMGHITGAFREKIISCCLFMPKKEVQPDQGCREIFEKDFNRTNMEKYAPKIIKK